MIALEGALLFLFIPLVLWLYLFYPLGILPSFGIAVPIMLGHRFVARPWMLRHRSRRCLWCGRALPRGAPPASLAIGEDSFVACDADHQDLAGRFATFVARYRLPLAAGIFGPLVVYLVTMIAAGLGRGPIPIEWDRFLFRSGIATTVVGVSLLYRTARAADPLPPFPFPIHNLFLLGVRPTLWVFRLVGAWWLFLSARFLLTAS